MAFSPHWRYTKYQNNHSYSWIRVGKPTKMMTMAQPILKVKYSDEKIKTRVNQFLSDVLDDRKYNVDKARR